MEEENKQNKSGSSQVIIILVSIIIAVIIAGGGVYLWMNNKDSETSAKKQTTTKDSTQKEKEPSVSPTKVAENFVLSTLGTVPGAEIDYEKAKTYLSKKLEARFTEDTFVPEFYGIQQGPDSYEMKTENISSDTASVKVDVRYGDMVESWSFILVKEEGEWKIDEFKNDAQ